MTDYATMNEREIREMLDWLLESSKQLRVEKPDSGNLQNLLQEAEGARSRAEAALEKGDLRKARFCAVEMDGYIHQAKRKDWAPEG